MTDPHQHEKYERYEGGSAEAERLLFEDLAREVGALQAANQARARRDEPDRAFHAKTLLAVEDARLRFHDTLPPDLCAGYAQPGAAYRALVRMSSASGVHGADAVPDLRGATVRVLVGDDERHDLLLLNTPASHAANAREFVAFATVMAGATGPLRLGWRFLVPLPRAVGRRAASRMRRTLFSATRRKVTSLATERYWSQAPVLWGDAGPVQYQLRPLAGGSGTAGVRRDDPDRLRTELAGRLRGGDVEFELCLQRFDDERTTPVEDASVPWPEDVAPPVPVAVLTVPAQDVDTPAGREVARRVEQLAFTPWRTTGPFRPLGNLNRSRDAAYGVSSSRRLGRP
ncbi:hypothetical protein ABT160_21380 [Streptomyces sp. NPDC001941]|uniref:hypothetical protein n=1 Tax=Streptomyces sp. NPDC001941 TaxID=3154659 RepID=UPI003319BDD4